MSKPLDGSIIKAVGKLLEVENIAQKQGLEDKGPVLFEGISFRWTSPGLHIVMGHSGAGKSSFLKTIGGVWRPKAGRVLINGQQLWNSRGAQPPTLLSLLGFAFQNNALFNSLRVLENVCFPHRQRFPEWKEKDREELGMNWLQKVGLEHAAYLYPHELSGGMQKRLSIARTLILQPDYIFLDDPTAGLDPITSKHIAELVNSLLMGSKALVTIVTNDPDRAKDWGPNIHFLENKTLYSKGTDGYEDMREAFL